MFRLGAMTIQRGNISHRSDEDFCFIPKDGETEVTIAFHDDTVFAVHNVKFEPKDNGKFDSKQRPQPFDLTPRSFFFVVIVVVVVFQCWHV